jgi:mycothiol synthase
VPLGQDPPLIRTVRCSAVHHVDVKRPMDQADIVAVHALAGALGDIKLSDAFAGVIATEDGGDRPVGYAHLTREPSGWALRFVVDPARRGADPTIGADLVDRAITVIREQGGGHVQLLVTEPGGADDALAAAHGLTELRDLYQMRRPLPVGEAWELETRPFRPGLDDAAWLVVNNRAFAWHPEQGGWDEAVLQAREAEPWFDPEGFLLHEEGGRLAGFCWTKIHADEHPPLGEIYVIAADPDWHGTGLGRRLTLAGLDYLAGKGLTIGMLYVDASNTAAVNLYVKLGFTIDHIDRSYGGSAESLR